MITSANNTQVKNIIQLNQKAKARREQGLFVAEGRKMFGEAPKDLSLIHILNPERVSMPDIDVDFGFERKMCIRDSKRVIENFSFFSR